MSRCVRTYVVMVLLHCSRGPVLTKIILNNVNGVEGKEKRYSHNNFNILGPLACTIGESYNMYRIMNKMTLKGSCLL